MAIDISPEQRETGKENFARTAEGLTRRGFMKSMVAGAAVVPVTAAVYFGYKSLKAAIIGCGDEGGVLIGEHNTDFLEFVACCDIRPYNLKRIFEGEPPASPRKGFKKVYGDSAEKNIKTYTDYARMLKDNPSIEAVVIALPLHLHAKAAVDCMRIGKERGRPIHVLCEKLMAWNIAQCKQMIAVAKETNSILSIGHQRHYSLLYAHAHEVIKSGVLGDMHHIRALWHRNNSWPYKAKPTDPPLVKGTQPQLKDGWFPAVFQEDADWLEDKANQKAFNCDGAEQLLKKLGYDSLEQLVRWRLYNETGGGLMAELGSHQLDACSIFLGKVHPLSVTGVGGKYFYRKDKNPRDSDDHVFVTFEFPGKNHPKGANKGSDKDDIVVVTYSSVNTNGFEKYGETVMGSRGTLIVEQEASLMLYPEGDPSKKQGDPKAITAGVTSGGAVTLDTSSTWGPATARPIGTAPGGPGTAPVAVSKGYREEMEDFAYCIRLWDAKQGYAEKPEKDRESKTDKYVQRLPRCHGEGAMADAIIALTSNLAMKGREVQVAGSNEKVHVNRIAFSETWFDAGSKDVPDGDTKPKMPVE